MHASPYPYLFTLIFTNFHALQPHYFHVSLPACLYLSIYSVPFPPCFTFFLHACFTHSQPTSQPAYLPPSVRILVFLFLSLTFAIFACYLPDPHAPSFHDCFPLCFLRSSHPPLLSLSLFVYAPPYYRYLPVSTFSGYFCLFAYSSFSVCQLPICFSPFLFSLFRFVFVFVYIKFSSPLSTNLYQSSLSAPYLPSLADCVPASLLACRMCAYVSTCLPACLPI